MIQTLDLGDYVSGVQAKGYKYGVWHNDELGEYKLCIYTNVDRYIVVRTTSSVYLFNLERVDDTDNFFKAFTDLLYTTQPQATS